MVVLSHKFNIFTKTTETYMSVTRSVFEFRLTMQEPDVRWLNTLNYLFLNDSTKVWYFHN